MAKYKIGQKCKINDPNLKPYHNVQHGQEVIIAGVFSSPNWKLALPFRDSVYYEITDLSGHIVFDKRGNGGIVRVPEKFLVPLTNPKQWTVEDTKNFLTDMTKQAKLKVTLSASKIKTKTKENI